MHTKYWQAVYWPATKNLKKLHVFLKQQFYKQHQAEIGKKSSKW